MASKNIGILASISWNSNRWQDQASKEDLNSSKFTHVIENHFMNEDLNFGINNFPAEGDGTYIGYTPQFNTLPSLEESKYVDIVFFRGLNYKNQKNYIVGFYAFPIIDRFYREAEHRLFELYEFGNVKAKVEHIMLLESFVEISDDLVAKKNLVPKGKEAGRMGYNYLSYQNVINLLDCCTTANPNDLKIMSLKKKFLVDSKYSR